MQGDRNRIVVWVGTHIMPHEPAVRAWLRRSMVAPDDIDDLIQEAYCKLAALESFEHIARPDRYFMQVVRNLLGEQIRRARVVQIETVAEMDALPIETGEPSMESAVSAARKLARVRDLIDTLPERCRRIFTLRKIEGMSQREIARRIGVSESVVENEGVKGMRLLMKAFREEEGGPNKRAGASYESTKRK